MIRVNLLPIKKARRRSEGRTQLIVFVTLILLECALMAVMYMNLANEVDELKEEVAVNQREVTKAENELKSTKVLEAKQAEQQKQLDILRELEKKRTGPVRVLDELQAVLSPPRNQQERHARTRMHWNVEWDTRRLWLETWSEEGGAFQMTGVALNADDVAEFLERLTSARYFDDILLEFVKAKSGGGDTVDLVEFSITGKLSYDDGSKKTAAGGS
jgi:Tfp pilus assembly protein PilN